MTEKNVQNDIMKVVIQGFEAVTRNMTGLERQQDAQQQEIKQLQQTVAQLQMNQRAQASSNYKAHGADGKASIAYDLYEKYGNQEKVADDLGITQGRVSQLIRQHKNRTQEKY